MTAPGELQRSRVERDAAKAALDQQVAQVRHDLDTRGIGGRIADTIIGEVADVAFEAIDIAESHKGIVAGTLVAIVAWFFRDPILGLVEHLGIGKDD